MSLFRNADKKGSIQRKDISESYKRHILSMADLSKIKPLKVVIDAGNGMGGRDIELIEKELPLKITKMYFEPDGSFPHHEANPLKEENLVDLKKRVIKERA